MKKITGIITATLLLTLQQSLFAQENETTTQDKTTFDCLVKPEMYIDISSPVSGVIESVFVKKTDSIVKGQKLAKLNASVELARMNVAKQVAMMDNQIYAKGVKLSYAKRKSKRIAGLFEENASSAQEQDEAATELKIARVEAVEIKLDKKKNELKLILAKAELEQKTITSPIDGIVVEQYLMPGELVQNKPILQLAKINPLLVEVVAPANVFGQVKPGMSVEVKPDFPVNSSYTATVTIVDRIIDAASGSFTIQLALPNPEKKLVAGTKCIAIFPVKEVQNNMSSSGQALVNGSLPKDIKTLLSQ